MHHRFAVALAVTAAAAFLAVPASAHRALTHQVDVTETSRACKFQLTSVSRRNTTIVFHMINNSSMPRGLVMWSVKSKLAPPKGSANLVMKFRGPGAYRYSCIAGSYKHPTVFARGIFRIRSR